MLKVRVMNQSHHKFVRFQIHDMFKITAQGADQIEKQLWAVTDATQQQARDNHKPDD